MTVFGHFIVFCSAFTVSFTCTMTSGTQNGVQPTVLTTTMSDAETCTVPVIFDAVLTFLQYGLNTATQQNVLKVASSTFSTKEVKAAVNQLWKVCKMGEPPNLRNSQNRSQCEAYLDALLKAMVSLISQKKFPKVWVDAIGLARIPKFRVEEISEVAIIERMMVYETKMSAMDEVLQKLSDSVTDINTTLCNNVHACRVSKCE